MDNKLEKKRDEHIADKNFKKAGVYKDIDEARRDLPADMPEDQKSRMAAARMAAQELGPKIRKGKFDKTEK